jgi:hypothetical protein
VITLFCRRASRGQARYPNRHRPVVAVVVVAAALALAACQTLVDPPLGDGAESFQPPSVYDRWWSMTESCSGLTGSLSKVSWFAVPGAPRSYYSLAGNRIVLNADSKLDGGHVRHEMLHALLQAGGHARKYFLELCGGVVNCDELCIADSEPPPSVDANVAHAMPEDLEVSVDVSPASPRRSEMDGFFTVTVSARNTASYPVVVQLISYPGFPANGFSVAVYGSAGGLGETKVALDPSVSTFAGGETKRQVFDFAVRDSIGHGGLPPGPYNVDGKYGSHLVTHERIVLSQ